MISSVEHNRNCTPSIADTEWCKGSQLVDVAKTGEQWRGWEQHRGARGQGSSRWQVVAFRLALADTCGGRRRGSAGAGLHSLDWVGVQTWRPATCCSRQATVLWKRAAGIYAGEEGDTIRLHSKELWGEEFAGGVGWGSWCLENIHAFQSVAYPGTEACSREWLQRSSRLMAGTNVSICNALMLKEWAGTGVLRH